MKDIPVLSDNYHVNPLDSFTRYDAGNMSIGFNSLELFRQFVDSSSLSRPTSISNRHDESTIISAPFSVQMTYYMIDKLSHIFSPWLDQDRILQNKQPDHRVTDTQTSTRRLLHTPSRRVNSNTFSSSTSSYCPPGLQLTGDGSDEGNLGRLYLTFMGLNHDFPFFSLVLLFVINIVFRVLAGVILCVRKGYRYQLKYVKLCDKTVSEDVAYDRPTGRDIEAPAHKTNSKLKALSGNKGRVKPKKRPNNDNP
jgi:hypothetical protein